MENEVILIAGKTNRGNTTLFWKNDIDIEDVEIGDYAIVENVNGYDLISIAGFVKTDSDRASLFSNTKYKNMKNTVMIIHKELISGGNKNEQKIIK